MRRTLNVCQSADVVTLQQTPCLIAIGQMLITPVPSRSIPTNPTQATLFLTQQRMKLFQTVNHASVLWDAKTKPKGIIGGHLNIQSIISKTEQLEHLLTDSNIDHLGLTETWLTPHTPRLSLMSQDIMRIDGIEVKRKG